MNSCLSYISCEKTSRNSSLCFYWDLCIAAGLLFVTSILSYLFKQSGRASKAAKGVGRAG